MYTKKTFNTLVSMTNLAWRIGVVHFHYVGKGSGKHKDYTLETCFKPSKLNLVKFTFLVNVFYLIFVAGRMLQQIFSDTDAAGGNLAFIVKMSYIFSAYSLTVVLQYTTVLKEREMPLFLEEYLAFFKDMRAKYLLPDQKGAKCRTFFSVFIFIGIAVNLQNFAILMVKPFNPHLFTSVLENPKNTSIIIRLPFLLAQCFIYASCWGNLWFYCFHWFTYITCSLFMMKELDVHVKRARTTRQVREPGNCLKILRSMQVLHRIWEINFQHWLCPSHKAVVCTISTLALYGVVKLSGPRAVIMGFVAVISLLYLSTLFYKFGQLHERSTKVIQNWKNFPGASKWMRKVVLSVPVFGIKIGSFYCVHRTTVINVLWTVLNNTITLFFI